MLEKANNMSRVSRTLRETSKKLDKVKEVHIYRGHPNKMIDSVRIELLNGDVIELKAKWDTMQITPDSERTDIL